GDAGGAAEHQRGDLRGVHHDRKDPRHVLRARRPPVKLAVLGVVEPERFAVGGEHLLGLAEEVERLEVNQRGVHHVDEQRHHSLRLGGVTMAVILAASVLALAVAIERLIALWGVSDSARMLGETVTRHLLAGNVPAARSAAERSGAVAADIYLAGFNRLARGP